jgi:hypothetical protein
MELPFSADDLKRIEEATKVADDADVCFAFALYSHIITLVL